MFPRPSHGQQFMEPFPIYSRLRLMDTWSDVFNWFVPLKGQRSILISWRSRRLKDRGSADQTMEHSHPQCRCLLCKRLYASLCATATDHLGLIYRGWNSFRGQRAARSSSVVDDKHPSTETLNAAQAGRDTLKHARSVLYIRIF